jgi:hypothetical protein
MSKSYVPGRKTTAVGKGFLRLSIIVGVYPILAQ